MVVTTVQQKNPSELLYISLAFGFSLATNAWVFFRISGGLFNPAVSIHHSILFCKTDIKDITIEAVIDNERCDRSLLGWY